VVPSGCGDLLDLAQGDVDLLLHQASTLSAQRIEVPVGGVIPQARAGRDVLDVLLRDELRSAQESGERIDRRLGGLG
jgi:hypothetical protein